MREHLPFGECGHNINPETLLCPVCSCRLIPSEMVTAYEDWELWYVECRKCGTGYITQQPISKLSIPTPINREYVLALEERILRLENFIRENLVARQNVTPQREEPKQEVLTNNNLTKQYAFLLNT